MLVDVIAPDPTVPARVTFAPLNVAAVVGVEPDLITNSPLEFVKLAKVVPSSFNITSAPSASNIISAPPSIVKSPLSDIVLPFIVISSLLKLLEFLKK